MRSFKVITVLISFLFLANCAGGTRVAVQPTETDGMMTDVLPMPIYLGNDARFSMPSFLWRSTQYMNFRLNKKEKQMHQSAVFFMLDNAKNGEIVSWYNKERLASGKVRVIHSYPTGAGVCRHYQAYIKLNGVAKHTTNSACKKIQSPSWSFYK